MSIRVRVVTATVALLGGDSLPRLIPGTLTERFSLRCGPALTKLRERLAAGEINAEEYEKTRSVLQR